MHAPAQLFGHWLLLAALPLPESRARPAPGDDPVQSTAAPACLPATPEERVIAAVLRESRRQDAAPVSRLVERILAAGPAALEAQIDILVDRCVPSTGPEDAAQILSEPQRELLLAALARMPSGAVRSAVDRLLEDRPDEAGARLAAVHALGAIGGAPDLDRLVRIAPRRAGSGAGLAPEAHRALRAACASILARDAAGHRALGALVCDTDPKAGRALLEGLGEGADARPSRALAVLVRAARCQPPLRPQVAALAAKCGRSIDAAQDREFALWALSELPRARPEYASSLLQAIGVLDDGTCVPAMIERLEDEHLGVRASALWALRRVSGLGFPGEMEPWLVWHREEVAWQSRERVRRRKDLLSRDPARVVEALRSYAGHRTKRAELSVEVAQVLADPRPELRLLACEVIQSLDSPAACSELAWTLEDPDAAVALKAWEALQSITRLDLPRDRERALEILH